MSKRSPDREADVGAPSAKRQAPAELDAIVVAKLNELYASGVCTEGDVDARAMEHLKGFPPSTAVEILDQFKNTDLTNVRNRSAYLSGVMGRFRKYDSEGGPPPHSGGGAGGGGRALPRMMQRRLDEIYERRGLSADTLDQRCLNALGQLPVSAAEAALDQLEKQDLAEIRSVPAWFMSVIKRHSQGAQSHRSGPPGGPMPPAGPPPPYAGVPPPMPPPPRGNGMGMQPPMHFEPPPRPPPPQHRGDFQGGVYGGRDRFDGNFGMPGMMPGMPPVPGYGNMMPQGMAPDMRPGMPPPMGMGMPPPGSSNDRSMDQIALGVRVDEFHNLSVHAPMVQAAPALKLQQLWDDGCRLVSLLDDRAWEALAALGAPEALVVIDEVADNMIRNADGIRNINAFFMSIANKYLRPGGESQTGGRGAAAHDARSNGPDGRQGASQRTRNDGPGDLSIVSPAIRQRIEALVTSHARHITRAHFDSGIINALNQIGDEGSLKVLDEISGNDLSNVRNPPGYMMGIISRYLRGDRQPR